MNELNDISSICAAAVEAIRPTLPVEYLALARAIEGRWRVERGSGPNRPLPEGLLAEVLDRDLTLSDGRWIAAPLRESQTELAEALAVAVRDEPTESPGAVEAVAAVAQLVGGALAASRGRSREEARAQRLAAILEITRRWNSSEQLVPLLEEMAEAATRLLGADRASIFLWDRANHELVGRPALGVEGGELRVPDDRGVVSQVVRGGEPRRVDADNEPEAIDHRVDERTGYRTRSILCVPLLDGSTGKPFGAFEVLNRREGPFTPDDETALTELAEHAGVALQNTRQREQLMRANRQMTEQAAAEARMIGQSPAIEALRSTVRRVADTELAVLILGENGTGKEVVAQSIHYGSARREQPLIAVNCAAIPDTLAESELFGHEKGAFTDAHDARPGKFELAGGGTLLLDEIGELSLGGQAKLLRVLEEKVFVRVGGSRPIHTDARVLAATNQDLVQMVREKRFREDLYFRLNVVSLELPPLRDRGDDILLLAEHFLSDFCGKARRPVPDFTAEARRRLLAHPWPGNVRELRNLMERLAYLSTSERIDADELAFIIAPGTADTVPLSASSGGRWSTGGEMTGGIPGDLPLADATAAFQSDYIRRVIRQAEGNISRAAEQLGLHRSNLYRKMRQLGMGDEG